MLELPRGLKITRDLEEEKDLLAKVRTFLEGEDRDPGVHVSDLMDPRQAVFKKLTGAKIPDRLLNVFIVGKVAHGIVELIHNDGEGEVTASDSGTKKEAGILYSPDAFSVDGSPVEIKTTRSFYLPKQPYLPDDSTYHMYIEQLMAYMALEGKITGRLTILYLNLKDETGKTAPQFYVWKITTTPEGIIEYKKSLEQTSASIQAAVTARNPRTLPLCRSWKCKDCEFWEGCKPEGRFEYGRDSKGMKGWTA